MEVVAFVGPSGTGKSHHAIGVAFDNRCDAIIDDGLLIKGTKILAGTSTVGDEELIKIHFHTNEPWKVLEYCASLGEIYDIVVEDMDRQSRGLHG
ncbi:hypothetical protein [Phascolarctobacterium succinatutens]|uniref:hypothetical protein n=1 Tax=Phascolarctobacterium succinatutens TaxID=626940 RepID=UPI0027B9BE2E|nr:hypothetical protein [Phascolarctobacterium succinatutens]